MDGDDGGGGTEGNECRKGTVPEVKSTDRRGKTEKKGRRKRESEQ